MVVEAADSASAAVNNVRRQRELTAMCGTCVRDLPVRRAANRARHLPVADLAAASADLAIWVIVSIRATIRSR